MKRFFIPYIGSMRIRLLLLVLLAGPFSVLHTQAPESEGEAPEGDPRYREDQIYLGLTYNLLTQLPEGISQSNLSYGIQLGVIRDMPLNERRTIALGLGLGYGVNSYYTNVRAVQGGESLQYVPIADASTFKRNKVETHLLEVPLELRWRNSTPEEYKFWRIYGGVKFGYVMGSRSKYVSESVVDSFYNRDTENFRYGLTLNVGYNTFNLHAYYGLNALFEDGTRDAEGRPLEMVPLRLGLIFYIL